jgi:hypothetical protein
VVVLDENPLLWRWYIMGFKRKFLINMRMRSLMIKASEELQVRLAWTQKGWELVA